MHLQIFMIEIQFGMLFYKIYILILTRKYETLIHSMGYGEKGCDLLAQPTIVVSKN